MSTSTALIGALCIAADVIAAGFVAWRLSGRVVEQTDTETCRLLVALVLGLTQLIGLELFCGALDLLYAPVVLLGHLALAAGVWVWVPARRRQPGISARPGWEVAVLAGVIGFAAVLAVILSARGAPSDADDIQYHVPNAASWIQVHNIWHLPAADPGYFTNAYPSDGELLTSWIMQPFHGAELATWPTLLFGILILLGSAVIAEQLGRRAPVGILAATAILLSPLSWQTQVHSALTDWTTTGGLIAGVAFALRARRDTRWCWHAMTGLALGIAIGSKDTSLLPGAAIAVFALVITDAKARWRSIVSIVGGVAALAGLWFVRTGIATGNPIYPEPIRFAGTTLLKGGISPLTQYSTSLAKDALKANTHALRAWEHYLRTLIGVPAIVAIGGLVAFWRARERRLLAWCAALAVAFFVAYAVTPYTGPGTEGFLIASQIRYALPALVLGAVCACVATRWLQYLAWIAVLYDLEKLARHPSINPTLHVSRTTLGLAVLTGIFVAAGLFRTHQGDISTWTHTLGQDLVPRVALVMVAFVGMAGVATVVAKHRAAKPNVLDRALSAVTDSSNPSGWSKRPVMIIGATDVLVDLGPRLTNQLVGAGTGSGGEIPITDKAALDHRVATVRPKAIVLGPFGAPGVIEHWSPSGYASAGRAGLDQYFVIRP